MTGGKASRTHLTPHHMGTTQQWSHILSIHLLQTPLALLPQVMAIPDLKETSIIIIIIISQDR